jgi:5-methylcytosine-specific restriction endonuclease McrA
MAVRTAARRLSHLQRDCVLALSRGGRYTLDNIVPACRSCNTSKCNEEVTTWLRRKRLDERAFLLRHHEISTALALQFRAEDAGHRRLSAPEGEAK